MDLFEYDISDRRTSVIFVEQKVFLNGIYQLLPFDKDGKYIKRKQKKKKKKNLILFLHRLDSMFFVLCFSFLFFSSNR